MLYWPIIVNDSNLELEEFPNIISTPPGDKDYMLDVQEQSSCMSEAQLPSSA